MRHKVVRQPAKAATWSEANQDQAASMGGRVSRDLLSRHEMPLAASRSTGTPSSAEDQAAVLAFKERLSTAIGCKTSEVAFALLGDILRLDCPSTTADPKRTNELLMNALAMLVELQPTTATEAILAVQMIGSHRAAMTFLKNAIKPEDSFDSRDRNVLRAMMRLFTEQIDAMAKLKGKSGQQRMVVEHVSVAAGGQAIVGTVIPGGRGTGDKDRR
jgi:hypothetical protein